MTRHSLYENKEAGLETEPGDICQCGTCGRIVRRTSEGLKYDYTPDFTCYVDPMPHSCLEPLRRVAGGGEPPKNVQPGSNRYVTVTPDAEPTEWGSMESLERSLSGSGGSGDGEAVAARPARRYETVSPVEPRPDASPSGPVAIPHRRPGSFNNE